MYKGALLLALIGRFSNWHKATMAQGDLPRRYGEGSKGIHCLRKHSYKLVHLYIKNWIMKNSFSDKADLPFATGLSPLSLSHSYWTITVQMLDIITIRPLHHQSPRPNIVFFSGAFPCRPAVLSNVFDFRSVAKWSWINSETSPASCQPFYCATPSPKLPLAGFFIGEQMAMLSRLSCQAEI